MLNTSRRTFLHGGVSAAIASSIPVPAIIKRRQRKNVLFIGVDDLNTSLGCYGNPVAQTPNLDRLAARGVRFDKAYCQYPWCSPSRSSLMTGLAPDTTRVYDLQKHFRQTLPNVVTLGQLFRENGYYSARVGKIFHYGNPDDIGTDGLDDPMSWDWTYNPCGVDHLQEESLVTSFTPKMAPGGAIAFHRSAAKDEEMTDGIGADHVIRLLQEHRAKPFFIAYGLFRPHVPWIVPNAYFERYSMDRIQAMPYDARQATIAPPVAYNTHPPNYGMDELQQRQAILAYYASTSFLDAQIGRVLKTLETQRLAEDTLVVFWTDHGWQLGQHGEWEKQTLFEDAVRVPVIFAGAGVFTRGKACYQPVEHLDLYPTLAELCELTGKPETLHGESLFSLIQNPEAPWSKPAVSQVERYANKEHPRLMGYSIRTGRYRYTSWQDGAAGEELYDYQTDTREQKNLAADPAMGRLKFVLKTNLHSISLARGKQAVSSV